LETKSAALILYQGWHQGKESVSFAGLNSSGYVSNSLFIKAYDLS